MKRFFQKTKEQLIDSIADESDLNPQIYDHLNSIIKLDMNGNLVTYNQAFAKQYGYNEQDFDKPFLDVFIKYETLEQKQFFEKAILGETQRFDALVAVKTERRSISMSHLIPIKTKAGMDVYVIVKNIAEYKRAGKRDDSLQKKAGHHLISLKIFAISTTMPSTIVITYSKQLPIIFGIDEEQKFFTIT